MRLAVFDDAGKVSQICSGDDGAIQAMQKSMTNSIIIGDDESVDLDRPIYVKDGSLQTQPELTDSEKNAEVMAAVRDHCQSELLGSDKWMLSDRPDYIKAKDSEWQTYRQNLRDLPATVASSVIDISDVTFPERPSFT